MAQFNKQASWTEYGPGRSWDLHQPTAWFRVCALPILGCGRALGLDGGRIFVISKPSQCLRER